MCEIKNSFMQQEYLISKSALYCKLYLALREHISFVL